MEEDADLSTLRADHYDISFAMSHMNDEVPLPLDVDAQDYRMSIRLSNIKFPLDMQQFRMDGSNDGMAAQAGMHGLVDTMQIQLPAQQASAELNIQPMRDDEAVGEPLTLRHWYNVAENNGRIRLHPARSDGSPLSRAAWNIQFVHEVAQPLPDGLCDLRNAADNALMHMRDEQSPQLHARLIHMLDEVNRDDEATCLLEGLRGEVVILDFFTMWCRPCINAMPKLSETQERYADRGLRVVAVCLNDEPRDAENLATLLDRDFAHDFALAEPGASETWDVRSLPSYALIGRCGTVRWTSGVAGSSPPDALLDQLLRESADGQ